MILAIFLALPLQNFAWAGVPISDQIAELGQSLVSDDYSSQRRAGEALLKIAQLEQLTPELQQAVINAIYVNWKYNEQWRDFLKDAIKILSAIKPRSDYTEKLLVTQLAAAAMNCYDYDNKVSALQALGNFDRFYASSALRIRALGEALVSDDNRIRYHGGELLLKIAKRKDLTPDLQIEIIDSIQVEWKYRGNPRQRQFVSDALKILAAIKPLKTAVYRAQIAKLNEAVNRLRDPADIRFAERAILEIEIEPAPQFKCADELESRHN